MIIITYKSVIATSSFYLIIKILSVLFIIYKDSDSNKAIMIIKVIMIIIIIINNVAA